MIISNLLILDFAQQLQRGGFADLLTMQPFYQQIILPILQSSPTLVLPFKESLHSLLNVLQDKVDKIPKMQENLPQLIFIMQRIRKSVGKPAKSLRSKELSNEDKNFIKFLKDEEAKLANPNNSSYYDLELQDQRKIKLRMPVLVSTKHFKQAWQIVFTTIRGQFKQKKEPNTNIKIKQSFQKIKKNNISVLLCLGCSQFFYEHVNIRDLQVNKTDLIVIPKVKQFSYHKELLKISICALLNSSGGVILFDCVEEYMQVLPVGSYISQLQKQQYQQQVSQIFKYFKPKISFGTHIDLTFVPIIHNPFKDIHNISKQNFIQGRYVMRLRVWNNQRYRLILNEELNSELCAHLRVQGQTVKCTGRELDLLIKKVFDRFYFPDSVDKAIFMPPQHCFQSHECKQPKMGIQLQTSKKDEVNKLTQYDLQEQFKYVSFMFLRQIDPSKVERMFKKEQKNKFVILPHNPKTVDNFCLLFHNTAHRQMKDIFRSISDPNKNQPPVLLFVQNGLQLEAKIEQSTFNLLVKYIRSKNSTQSLKYIEGPKTYAVTAGFRVSLFYIFAKLKQLHYINIKLAKLDIVAFENDERFKIIQAPFSY